MICFGSNGSGNLTASEAACADVNGLAGSVYVGVNLSYVSFPGSGRSSLGVRYVVAERNTLAAAHTFSHYLHLPDIVSILQSNLVYNVKTHLSSIFFKISQTL